MPIALTAGKSNAAGDSNTVEFTGKGTIAVAVSMTVAGFAVLMTVVAMMVLAGVSIAVTPDDIAGQLGMFSSP